MDQVKKTPVALVRIGMAACRDSVGLGSSPALEKREEAVSVSAGGNRSGCACYGPKQQISCLGSKGSNLCPTCGLQVKVLRFRI